MFACSLAPGSGQRARMAGKLDDDARLHSFRRIETDFNKPGKIWIHVHAYKSGEEEKLAAKRINQGE